MSNDSSFNNFQNAIVLKATIDGGLKIIDKVGKNHHELEIGGPQYPDLILELYHHNHPHFATHGITKFKVTLSEVVDPLGLLAFLMPGTMLGKLTLDPKRGLVVQVDGKEKVFLIRRYAAKHLAR